MVRSPSAWRPSGVVGSAWRAMIAALAFGCGGPRGLPPDPPPSNVIEAVPPTLQVDGVLTEWTGPPNLVGERPAPDAPQRHLWLGLSSRGLAMAGKVTFASQARDELVEFSIGLKEPTFDELCKQTDRGFEYDAEHEDSCAGFEPPFAPSEREGRAMCREVYDGSRSVRRGLRSMFRARYLLARDGKVWSNQSAEVMGASVAFHTLPNGYSFEALVPPEALPLAAEFPLQGLQAAAHFEPARRREGTAVSVPRLAEEARRATWASLKARLPARMVADPGTLAKYLVVRPPETFWYQPSRSNTRIHVLTGHPESGSKFGCIMLPVEVSIDLGLRKRLAEYRGFSVALLTEGAAIATYRGADCIDMRPAAWSSVYAMVERSPGLHVLVPAPQFNVPGGLDCGSCAVIDFHLFTIDEAGKISEPVGFDGRGGNGETNLWPFVASRLAYFGVRSDLHAATGCRRIERKYTWQPERRTYVRSEKVLPAGCEEQDPDSRPPDLENCPDLFSLPFDDGAPASPPPVQPLAPTGCPVGMAAIPAGNATIPGGRPVKLDDFCLDLTEVTADDWALCVRAGRCLPRGEERGCNSTGDHPVNCVDWEQARAYCGWVGKELPTEAQWEYAARGGARQLDYPWGSAKPSRRRACWNREEGEGKDQGTCAVGSFPPGAFGLKDMAGNVKEWLSEWYVPKGGRVQRGGSWKDKDPLRLLGTAREHGGPVDRGTDLGFRCARARQAKP